MDLIIAMLVVVVLGVAAVAATGSLGAMPETDDDTFAPALPQGQITAQDVQQLKFGVQIRGYDMQQVDEVLDRLAKQIDGGACPTETRTDEQTTQV